jgi:hypothetical protein
VQVLFFVIKSGDHMKHSIRRTEKVEPYLCLHVHKRFIGGYYHELLPPLVLLPFSHFPPPSGRLYRDNPQSIGRPDDTVAVVNSILFFSASSTH